MKERIYDRINIHNNNLTKNKNLLTLKSGNKSINHKVNLNLTMGTSTNENGSSSSLSLIPTDVDNDKETFKLNLDIAHLKDGGAIPELNTKFMFDPGYSSENNDNKFILVNPYDGNAEEDQKSKIVFRGYNNTIINHKGKSQGGGATTITLESSASSTDDFYNGSHIYINSGTGSGQTKKIMDYVGSTKVATVNSDWTNNPDSTSINSIYNSNDLAYIEGCHAGTGDDKNGKIIFKINDGDDDINSLHEIMTIGTSSIKNTGTAQSNG